MTPFAQKMIMVGVALATAVLAHYLGQVEVTSLILYSVPGVLLGWGALRRPGDVPPASKRSRRPFGGPRSGPLMALALSSAAASGCGPHRRVEWPDVVSCAPDAGDIAATVSRILLAGDGPSMGARARRELARLALVHGTGTVVCLVDLFADSWRGDPEKGAAAKRCEDFIDSTGVKVISRPPGSPGL